MVVNDDGAIVPDAPEDAEARYSCAKLGRSLKLTGPGISSDRGAEATFKARPRPKTELSEHQRGV